MGQKFLPLSCLASDEPIHFQYWRNRPKILLKIVRVSYEIQDAPVIFKDGNVPVTPVPALAPHSSKVKGFRAKRPLTFSLISIIRYREGFSLPLSAV